MAINKEEVESLKANLRLHAKRYNQEVFAEKTDCGTTACLAGFCLLADLGTKEFNERVKNEVFTVRFEADCVDAGKKRLGIKGGEFPQIFTNSCCWPADLERRYELAKTNKERVEVACDALDRLNANGTIKRDKKAEKALGLEVAQ
jgi:hypothetical protein